MGVKWQVVYVVVKAMDLIWNLLPRREVDCEREVCGRLM
jgi:hypothetical protein